KRAYCLKTQPATGETYPKSDLFNKAGGSIKFTGASSTIHKHFLHQTFKLLPLLHGSLWQAIW
ncbi:hypothetical protein, partial [Klebsiella pneumoniae]